MTTTELYLCQTDKAQPLKDYDVRERVEASVAGADGTFAVIASSHYIAFPTIGYYELLSCKKLPDETVETIPLTVGEQCHRTASTDAFTAVTHITGEPLAAFPGPDTFDVVHEFGTDAHTAINVADDGFTTYHTYPEYDLALYSHTELTTHHSHRIDQYEVSKRAGQQS